jgi:hypothetical protein
MLRARFKDLLSEAERAALSQSGNRRAKWAHLGGMIGA